jgi:hypothetical protein
VVTFILRCPERLSLPYHSASWLAANGDLFQEQRGKVSLSLRETAKLMADADRHAKKELKKRVRGVRPIERELEERTDEEAEVVRGDGLASQKCIDRRWTTAFRHGRAPVAGAPASHFHLDQPNRGKKGLPIELARLQRLIQIGLKETETLWPAIKQANDWLHQAAHLWANAEQREEANRKQQYEQLLSTMCEPQER